MMYAGRKDVIIFADGHLSEHVPHWKHNSALDPPLAANSFVNSVSTFFKVNTEMKKVSFLY
jgi:hypothetical protein